MLLHHGQGKENVNVGDRFEWWDGSRWEVAAFVASGMYSPSGLGGTPTIALKPVGETLPRYLCHVEPDGTVHWCGDSVAAGLSRNRLRDRGATMTEAEYIGSELQAADEMRIKHEKRIAELEAMMREAHDAWLMAEHILRKHEYNTTADEVKRVYDKACSLVTMTAVQ